MVEVVSFRNPDITDRLYMAIPELTLDEAWSLLSDEPTAILIDVRTKAEWNFVGTPDLSSIDKSVRLVEWITFPGGEPNPDFLAEATAELDPTQPVLLLCRSGARSLAAAGALREAGFATTYNVVAGFEGDLDSDKHRQGGWNDHLPWTQG